MSDLRYPSLYQINTRLWNYAPSQSQCYVRLPFTDLGQSRWRFEDVLGKATYDREGNDLQARGLYPDVPPWQAAVFPLTRRGL